MTEVLPPTDMNYFKAFTQKHIDYHKKAYQDHEKIFKEITDRSLLDGLRRYLVELKISQQVNKNLMETKYSDWYAQSEHRLQFQNKCYSDEIGRYQISSTTTHVNIPTEIEFHCLEVYCDNRLIYHYAKHNLIQDQGKYRLPVPIIKEKATESEWIIRLIKDAQVINIKEIRGIELWKDHQVEDCSDYILFANQEFYVIPENGFKDIHHPGGGISNIKVHSGRVIIKMKKNIGDTKVTELEVNAIHGVQRISCSDTYVEIINIGTVDVQVDIYSTNVFIYHNNQAGIRLYQEIDQYCQCEHRYGNYIKYSLNNLKKLRISKKHPNIQKYLTYINPPLNFPLIINIYGYKNYKNYKKPSSIHKYLFNHLQDVKYLGKQRYIFTFRKPLTAKIHTYNKIIFSPSTKGKITTQFLGIVNQKKYHYTFPILENAEQTHAIEISDFFSLRVQEYIKPDNYKVITHGSCISRAHPDNKYTHGKVTSYQLLREGKNKIDISTGFGVNSKKNDGLKIKINSGITLNQHVWAYKITYYQGTPCLVEMKIPRDSPIAGRPNENKYRTRDIEVYRMWYLVDCGNRQYYTNGIATLSHARYDPSFSYQLGQFYSIKNYDPNLNAVCRPGIHFCLTPEECVRYMLQGTFPQNQQITSYHIMGIYNLEITHNIASFL